MVLSQGPPLISPLHLLGLEAGASNAVGNVKSPGQITFERMQITDRLFINF